MPQRTLKDIVGNRDLQYVAPDAPVHEACQKMHDHHVTAVLVIDGDQLKGIFTKRDLLRRVVVAGLDPNTTPIAAVMTSNPIALAARKLGFEAVRTMRDEKTRHMVVTGLQPGPYGVISLRDILGKELAAFENELAFENKVWEEI